nr:RecName: Full=Glyceraldehyde-3-phosphate dehydrogenase B; AltName: Full=NADP-dependent glyceraldehydephosphate dehydrogenase subunit B [Populus euphratica]
AVSLVLPQLK